MNKKIGIILISIVFILTNFSGCTEFDGDDGFFDWLAEDGDDHLPYGSVIKCIVYGYVTISADFPEGIDEFTAIVSFGYSDVQISKTFIVSRNLGIENEFIQSYWLDELNNTAIMSLTYVYEDSEGIEHSLNHYSNRYITFDQASNYGTEDMYDFNGIFHVTYFEK